jgi:tetratricopeptide (TPR) repeat protein
MEASEEASAAFGHLGDLLSAFDDDDYDNILGDEDARSRADSSPGKAKKARKAQQLPDKFGLVYKRGVDLYLNGDHEEALEVFLEISHGVKNYAPLYNQMADCYQCLGRIEEAFESCKKAVNIDVQYLEAWARYVELAELMDSEELVHGLKKYIRLNLEKGDTSVLQHIRRLIELLEVSSSLKLLAWMVCILLSAFD